MTLFQAEKETANSSDRNARWPLRTFFWLLVVVGASLALNATHSPLEPLPGTVAVLFLPGAVLMTVIRARPAKTAARTVLALCFSLLVIMVVGAVISLIGPHIGLSHPLDFATQRIVWLVLGIVALVVSAISGRDPVAWIFGDVHNGQVLGLLVGGVVVLLAILGVARLNHSRDDSIAVFSAILDVALLLIGVVGGWSRSSRWPLNTLLYFSTLALLLSTSLRGGHLYGWDIQQEFGVASQTSRRALWLIPSNHDSYASMLSLTVLPAILHSLVKLRLTAFFELVVPGILAFLPVAMFSASGGVPRWIKPERPAPRSGLALGVVVGFIISSQVFPAELPAISRQALALTIFTSIVMVAVDRTISIRSARTTIALLIVAISFTHYSTSYLLAVGLLISWLAGIVWSRGWTFVPEFRIQEHQTKERSRKIINLSLVLVALVAAFGWNLGITRNNALSRPSQAIAASGVNLTTKGSVAVSAPALEKLLVRELRVGDKWLQPISGSATIKIVNAITPSSPGVVPSLARWWNRAIGLLHDGLWLISALALLYGIYFLERRNSNSYSSDLVGFAIAGLFIGVGSRFSGTIAMFYSAERAAIVSAILLVVPATVLLDDIAAKVSKTALLTGLTVSGVLVLWASGLGTLFFGGQAPAALAASGENDERFIVSTPEFATAGWLRKELNHNDLVQSDLFGQLVLFSAPGSYGLLPEIVPPEVDHRAFVYLSTTNILQGRARASAANGNYLAVYKTDLNFFNENFFVVYSTGVTRVYHR